MKFTIDTKNKTVTLLEAATFKELKSIRQFIGEEAEEWQIIFQVTTEYVTTTNPYHYWPPYPFWYFQQPCIYAQTAGYSLGVPTLTTSPVQYQFYVSGQGPELTGLSVGNLVESTSYSIQ